MIRAPFSIAARALVVLTVAGAARAQDEPPTAVPIVVRPAAAPVPALKYRILPERSTLVPGNAAIFYHRAIEVILELRRLTPSVQRRNPGQLCLINLYGVIAKYRIVCVAHQSAVYDGNPDCAAVAARASVDLFAE